MARNKLGTKVSSTTMPTTVRRFRMDRSSSSLTLGRRMRRTIIRVAMAINTQLMANKYKAPIKY